VIFVGALTEQNREDAEILVRMLYYCSEPRLPSQIKSCCDIDSVQFNKFAQHCISRGLLGKFLSTYGEFSYVVTDHGRRTLGTAQEVLAALGIKISVPDARTHANPATP
jgi:predicted transcriptional regulator